MTDAQELLNAVQLAKRWGITKQALHPRTKTPGFPTNRDGKTPKYPWPEVNDWWLQHQVRRAVEKSRPSASLADAKLRKLSAEAEMAEIDRDRASGKVIEVAAVSERWVTILLRVRAKLTARPSYEAPLLVGKTEKEIRAELTRYNLEIFAELRGAE